MERVIWSLALVVTFLMGLTVSVGGTARSGGQEADQLRVTATRLQQQVSYLQARLQARGGEVGGGQEPTTAGQAGPLGSSYPGAETRPVAGVATTSIGEERASGAIARPGRETGALLDGRASGAARGKATPTPTVEAALDRFYRYLEVTSGSEGGDRRPRARELVAELKAMGDVGAEALLQVLATGSDSEERRAAARLLGTLQVPEALPLLYDVLHGGDDVLLRRAAAAALGRLQTPDSMPVMQALLADPGEDRFVRVSAGYGLARAGSGEGVAGLIQIFEESSADGRGRDLAFRTIASLNDGRSLPFLRHIVASPVEPTYRLHAIRVLGAQGDRQSLGALQQVMQSPTEQASLRDAAAQAYRSIASR